MKPGDDVLLFIPRPRLHVLAVRVARVWTSKAGTERVEVIAARDPLRRSACFDARQMLPLSALENLPAAPAENPPIQKMAGAGAVCFPHEQT